MFNQGTKAKYITKKSAMNKEQSAEEILAKYYQPGMHWRLVNKANVIAAMMEFAAGRQGLLPAVLPMSEALAIAENRLKGSRQHSKDGNPEYHYLKTDLYEDVEDVIKFIYEEQGRVEAPASPELHPDTLALVNEFSKALSEKLIANQRKYGYTNEWLLNDWEEECRQHMMQHIQKGDPRDVAIYAAFMWKRGWSMAASLQQGEEMEGSDVRIERGEDGWG